MVSYRNFRSICAGRCQNANCEHEWRNGDWIYVCEGHYYCSFECMHELHPDAVQDSTNNNTRTTTNHPLESTHGGNDGSTTHSSNASVTTPPLSIPPARWELVTADDGMIVLRRR